MKTWQDSGAEEKVESNRTEQRKFPRDAKSRAWGLLSFSWRRERENHFRVCRGISFCVSILPANALQVFTSITKSLLFVHHFSLCLLVELNPLLYSTAITMEHIPWAVSRSISTPSGCWKFRLYFTTFLFFSLLVHKSTARFQPSQQKSSEGQKLFSRPCCTVPLDTTFISRTSQLSSLSARLNEPAVLDHLIGVVRAPLSFRNRNVWSIERGANCTEI